ncbi:hypothetical protein CROQUDRAFT_368802 [Cronartium quercuum f. sp. fusiforme G11]|uniref:Uncharacterized protein n=1 Tax=Cronartium quercuum f. sp. fusiforme G11 TaxID=708437 RepID=A0A9P6NKT1_9BASI|nr:hypothetical protein CROQUDRAFT_368802 [Cronartium quercuum f. sp. fusiforme G11]
MFSFSSTFIFFSLYFLLFQFFLQVFCLQPLYDAPGRLTLIIFIITLYRLFSFFFLHYFFQDTLCLAMRGGVMAGGRCYTSSTKRVRVRAEVVRPRRLIRSTLRSADRFSIIGYRTARAERDEKRKRLTRDSFTINKT